MSYQVLARKWRPRTFQTMVGQEHVLRMLTNALDTQRLHHAYLFTGTRGVGKTTFARIFAKSLNCEQGISSTPCNECSTCQSIDAGRFVDLLEIDAASRTKVEDTRELLDNVHYTPTQGRFKVYLIDEVHMLSTHSFNALLKTLEEPPAHVKFLLATTDPKRLPITILSRCLQFNLKRVPEEQISQHLAHIGAAEKIMFEEAALALIAHAADGSLRDALSLFDQAIAFCHSTITAEETRQMLGHMDQNFIIHLLTALANQDGKQLYIHIQEIAQQAPDYNQLLSQLLSTLHQIAVIQMLPDAKTSLENLTSLAQKISPEETQLYYQIALIGRNDLPFAPRPADGFEMIMLRMLSFKPTPLTQPPQPPTLVETVETTINWPTLLPKLQLTGIAYALASNCSLVNLQDNKIELALGSQHESLLNKRVLQRIEEALSTLFGKPFQLIIKTTPENIETPAKKQQQESSTKQIQAADAIKNDSKVQKILDVFNATLDPKSIKALEPNNPL